MKTIKSKTVIMLALALNCLICLTQDAAAQSKQGFKDVSPAQRAQTQTEMMKTRLKLDSAQLLQVQSINSKYAEKFDPVLKSNAGRFSKLRQLKSLQDQKNKEMKVVLRKDQFKQYQQLQAELKEKVKDAVQSSN